MRARNVSLAAPRDHEGADPGTSGTTSAARERGLFLRRMRCRGELARAGPRRRVQGLRREEVAAAASISVTWYTWLEQGRPVRISGRTVRALARALRLDGAATAHLAHLSEAAVTAFPRWRRTKSASPAVRAFVDGLAEAPAYVVNGRWDVLHANDAARAVLGAFDRAPGVTDNVLVRLFLDPDWRTRFADWENVALGAVAQFRAATGHLVAHPDWVSFIDALARRSPEFGHAWSERAVVGAGIRQKRVVCSGEGPIELLYATVAPDGEPDDVRVALYAAADARARAALQSTLRARVHPGPPLARAP